MIKIRTTLLSSLLLCALSSPLYSASEFSALEWKIPFYDGMLNEESYTPQWMGFFGFAAIAGYMAYGVYKSVAASVRASVYGPEKCCMTPKDKVLLRFLLSCAAKDLARICAGGSRALQVGKLSLADMSPAYAAEAELMRQEFMQIAKACQHDVACRALLESFCAQWHNAVEAMCASAQCISVQQQIIE